MKDPFPIKMQYFIKSKIREDQKLIVQIQIYDKGYY